MTINSTAGPIPIADREHGTYPLEDLQEGWANVTVTSRKRPHLHRYEIIDLKSGLLYRQEPLAMVATKCFELFCFSIFYFLAYAAFQMVRLAIAPLIHLSPVLFLKEVWKAVQIPFYFLAMQFAAFYGIFKPLLGRAWVGAIESLLHDGKTREQALQYKKGEEAKEYKKRPSLHLFWDLWEGISAKENSKALFIAYCMQPLGRSSDDDIEVTLLPNPSQSQNSQAV